MRNEELRMAVGAIVVWAMLVAGITAGFAYIAENVARDFQRCAPGIVTLAQDGTQTATLGCTQGPFSP